MLHCSCLWHPYTHPHSIVLANSNCPPVLTQQLLLAPTCRTPLCLLGASIQLPVAVTRNSCPLACLPGIPPFSIIMVTWEPRLMNCAVLRPQWQLRLQNCCYQVMWSCDTVLYDFIAEWWKFQSRGNPKATFHINLVRMGFFKPWCRNVHCDQIIGFLNMIS